MNTIQSKRLKKEIISRQAVRLRLDDCVIKWISLVSDKTVALGVNNQILKRIIKFYDHREETLNLAKRGHISQAKEILEADCFIEIVAASYSNGKIAYFVNIFSLSEGAAKSSISFGDICDYIDKHSGKILP